MLSSASNPYVRLSGWNRERCRPSDSHSHTTIPPKAEPDGNDTFPCPPKSIRASSLYEAPLGLLIDSWRKLFLITQEMSFQAELILLSFKYSKNNHPLKFLKTWFKIQSIFPATTVNPSIRPLRILLMHAWSWEKLEQSTAGEAGVRPGHTHIHTYWQFR